MKRLIISEILEDYNPREDKLFGPWCIRNRMDLYTNWKVFNFPPDPFPTSESLHENSILTCSYANNLIFSLSNKMNRINNTVYSVQFWRLLLFPWLLTLVQTTWMAQCRVKQFIKRNGKVEYCIKILSDNVDWNFRDTKDFLNRGVTNPVYNEWLYSRFIEKSVQSSWKVKIDKSKNIDDSILEQNISWKNKIYNRFLKNGRCHGLPSRYLQDVLDRRAVKDIERGTPLNWDLVA